MCPHGHALADKGAGAGAQDQVEGVLGIDSKAADLGAVHLKRTGDIASLLAISVEAQGHEVGGGELNGVPFEDDRSLGGIAAAEDGGDGLRGAKRVVDLILEGAECAVGGGFLGRVLRDVDVDDASGRDVWGEEDGRELDLQGQRHCVSNRYKRKNSDSNSPDAYPASEGR